MDVAASSSAIAVPSAASPSQLKRNKPFAPICRSSTRSACTTLDCTAAHFARSITPYTELALGDCSYLNTCHRRFDSCRYVHWALEAPEPSFVPVALPEPNTELDTSTESRTVLPEQWLNVDLRSFDVSVLGKFDVITADPPWAIHQDLPWTLTDEEMLHMPVGQMQNEGGLLFLWVTGRAMELGRSCLDAWGYDRIDEIIWVKMNQLQGLIRTGRTGHWVNHSKEHCLVAIRRSDHAPAPSSLTLPKRFMDPRRIADTQVILAEVRETSRKPDELYDMIERLFYPVLRAGSEPNEIHEKEDANVRMVELFGREHNKRPGWLTLGNQFVARGQERRQYQIVEPDVVEAFNSRYHQTPISLTVA